MPSTKNLLILNFAIISSIPTIFATGTLTIISSCAYNVYFQVCPAKCCTANPDGTSACPPWFLLPPSATWTMPFSQFPPVNSITTGVSIKMGTGGPSITQLEISWNEDAGQEFYDISNLGNKDQAGNLVPGPFQNDGLVLWADQPASAAFPTCQTIHCAAREIPCTDGYWIGEAVDEHGESIANHIMACSDTANLFLDLCSG